MRLREAEDRRRENQLVPGLLVYWFSHVRSVIEDTHVLSVLHTSSCFLNYTCYYSVTMKKCVTVNSENMWTVKKCIPRNFQVYPLGPFWKKILLLWNSPWRNQLNKYLCFSVCLYFWSQLRNPALDRFVSHFSILQLCLEIQSWVI